MSIINAQLTLDKQKMDNLSLRVENLQQARMRGLTQQEAPKQVSAPSSGFTPHVNDGDDDAIEF